MALPIEYMVYDNRTFKKLRKVWYYEHGVVVRNNTLLQELEKEYLRQFKSQ